MKDFINKPSKTAGLVPGAMVHVGERRTEKVKVTVIDYNEDTFEEKVLSTVEECLAFKEKPTVTWINVDGVHDLKVIEKIGTCFNLHPLTLEDIVNTSQRPKIEGFDEYIYIVAKMIYTKADDPDTIFMEHVSFVLGPNLVLSFQEGADGDIFDGIRQRLRTGIGRVRKQKADFLAYSLLDAIVDSYFEVMEQLGEKAELISDETFVDPSPEILKLIHALRQEVAQIRRSIWALREVIARMERTESKLIAKGTRVFLRDVYDHAMQIIEAVETTRDIVTGMMDIYLSSVSNRMNEIMKVLTIISTIFIPLTFIVGIYGMNFDVSKSPWNMPELEWRFGYPFVIGLMAFVTIIMLRYFKRKNWF